jgi:chromosome partitioning protein
MYTLSIESGSIMIVSILSRKGGSGKSVTAMHAAAYLESQGRPACVVDLDPEGTALAWMKSADALPFPVHPSRELERASKSGRIVLIDTPPNDAKTLGLAARVADRVIVVSGANPLEADRLGPTLDALDASGFSGPWGVLLTRVPRGKLGPAMIEALEAAGLNVLGSIPSRVEYERAFGESPKRLDDYEMALKEFLK